jgi:RNA polymerase sigma-70 factor (ECF subfamily)
MAERTPQPREGKPTDDDLVDRTRRGDRDAFGVLWDRHHRRIYEYCYCCLGEREAAEDAASDTFRKALAALPKYREQRFREWLFAIAHNVIFDALRTRRPIVPLEEAYEMHADEPGPEDLAVKRGACDEVAELLAQLSPDQRAVIAIRLAGLEPNEIAQALGKSRPALDMIYHRALVRLRTLMGIDSTPDGESGDE